MDFSFKIYRLAKSGFLLCFWFLICLMETSAQEVEHNYPVGPQNTDCDSIQLSGLSMDEIIRTIENTSYRFDQGFKISRITGVRAGHFYSCNGTSGFLVLTIGKEKKVFVEVLITTWDELIGSSDPDGFYEEKIKNKCSELTEF